MAQGFFDDSTGVSDGEIETCPAGEYAVNGIRWLKSCTEDNGNPLYKTNKRGMVVMMELNRTDGGSPNPVYSANPEEMVLLVRAFGGDVNKLPPNKRSTEFLVRSEDLITKSGGTVHAVVGDKGWAKVKEATVPEGLYRIRYSSARSLDGSEVPHFVKVGKGDPSLILQFEIIGNTFGKRTPFDGIVIDVFLPDPFDGSHNGVPKLRKNESSKKPIGVVRFEKFVAAFAPEVFYHDWNEFELANPIETILNYANEGRNTHEAVCSYQKSTRSDKCYLDLMTLATDESDEQPEEKSLPEEKPEQPTTLYVVGSDFYKQHPNLATLADWMYRKNPVVWATVPVSTLEQLKLSDVGRGCAVELLADAWNKLGWDPTTPKPLKTLTEEEARQVLDVVQPASAGWS